MADWPDLSAIRFPDPLPHLPPCLVDAIFSVQSAPLFILSPQSSLVNFQLHSQMEKLKTCVAPGLIWSDKAGSVWLGMFFFMCWNRKEYE